MTLSSRQRDQLITILQQLLPGHAIEQWTEQTGLIGDIPEFDSMMLTNLLTSIEDVYGVDIDESELSMDDFVDWGSLQRLTARLVHQ
ncbi:acyl carrier protein [Neiella sp. HB171785]|uniref:Acyl carrier protein n=1 Tax=Neiella litorisoli TaxID=2771431 RepID=A0A8J6QJX4_9GAMM|nr:phosphopantetheine-binding protein [Neiella litorisoli]MBD1390578.1 acyl carrier protein [Neiella litorisoli]